MTGILGAFSNAQSATIERYLSTALGTFALRGRHCVWAVSDRTAAASRFGGSVDVPEALRNVLAGMRPAGPFAVASFGICADAPEACLAPGRFVQGAGSNCVVLLDGRLDNRNELRALLAADDEGPTRGADGNNAADPQRHATDALLLCRAWERWGTDCFDRLDGAYVAAIWQVQTAQDEQRRDVGRPAGLHLVRDVCGARSLYYSVDTGVAFASGTAALLALTGRRSRLTHTAARAFLAGHVHEGEPRALPEGIRQVLPGQRVFIRLAADSPAPVEAQSVRYWQFPAPLPALALPDAIVMLQDLLRQAIAPHVSGRHPGRAGVALSSGLDSSALVAAWQRLNGAEPDLQTFTFAATGAEITPALQEARRARDTARQFGCRHHEITLSTADVVAQFEAVVATSDLPFIGPVALAQRRVFEVAQAAGVETMLSGHGPDLLLGGSISHVVWRLQTLLRQGHWQQAWQFSAGAADSNGVSRARLIRKAVRRRGHASMAALIGDQLLRTASPRTLWIEEQNAVLTGLYGRSPFMSRALIDFSLALPEHLRVDDAGIGKTLLRQAMQGQLPASIVAPSRHIGFPVPVHSWLHDNRLAFSAWLAFARTLPFCDARQLDALWRSALAGNIADCYVVWRWLSLAGWIDERDVELLPD